MNNTSIRLKKKIVTAMNQYPGHLVCIGEIMEVRQKEKNPIEVVSITIDSDRGVYVFEMVAGEAVLYDF
jgi:hypothetical protein